MVKTRHRYHWPILLIEIYCGGNVSQTQNERFLNAQCANDRLYEIDPQHGDIATLVGMTANRIFDAWTLSSPIMIITMTSKWVLRSRLALESSLSLMLCVNENGLCSWRVRQDEQWLQKATTVVAFSHHAFRESSPR